MSEWQFDPPYDKTGPWTLPGAVVPVSAEATGELCRALNHALNELADAECQLRGKEMENASLTKYAENATEALRTIRKRGIYPVNGGFACATCTTFWGADSKYQTEHHYDRCAYVIARDALESPELDTKNPNPTGNERGASAVDRGRNVPVGVGTVEVTGVVSQNTRNGGFDSRSLAESRCEKAGSNPAEGVNSPGLDGSRGLTAGKDRQPPSSLDAATRDIHSPFNACMHRDYCRSLESLKSGGSK